MHRIRTSLTTAAFVSFALGARPASAQEPAAPPAPTAFDLDTEYAQRLAERGYREAAEWKMNELKKTPTLNAEQKATISFLEANLAVVAFDLEKNFQTALALQAKAKKGLEEYLKTSPKGPTATKARYLLGELGKKLGTKVVEQIRKENGAAEKIAELRKLGDAAFKEAEDYFRERAKDLAAAAQQGGQGTPPHNEWMAALYALPDCLLSHASLFPEGDDKRKRLLELADSNFGDFTLEADNELVVYFEAMVKWGTVQRELGKITDAIESYGHALDLLYELRESPQDPKVVASPDQFNPNQKFVILDAAAEYAKLQNKVKKFDDVIRIAVDVKRGIPDLDQFDRGSEFLLEVALAYESLQKIELAVAEAKRVVKSRPSDSVLTAALELLDRNGGRGTPGGGVTVDQLVVPIGRAINEKNWPEAIRQYHRALQRIREDSQAQKFLPDVVFSGAYAYDKSMRPLEAIALWEAQADQFPDHKQTPNGLGYAAIAACNLYSQTKALWAEARAREIRDRLQSNYPDSEAAAAANRAYIRAVQAVGGKNTDELSKLLIEDAKRLGKTDAGYGAKANEVAVMFFNDALAQKAGAKESARKSAEEWFDNFIEWAKAQTTTDPIQIAKTQEKWLNAEISIARMWLWEPGSKPDKTLTVAQGIEERMAKLGGANRRQPEIEDLKIQAFLKSGKLDSATQVVEGLLTKIPDSIVTVRSAKRISDYVFDELRNRKLDPQKIPALVDAGLRYTKAWIQHGEKQEGRIDAGEYDTAAVRLFNWGLQKNGIDKFPGTFTEVDQAKLAFKEPIELAADYFSKALAANEAAPEGKFQVTLVRFRRAQALGLLGKLDELASEYSKIAEANGMLEPSPDGAYAIKLPPEVKAFGYQLLNEWAFALADAAKRGDKKAGLESMKISGSVIKATNPGSNEGSKEWWQARYMSLVAAENLGQYATAQALIEDYLRTDKDLDKGKFGYQARIQEIYARVKGRTDAPLPQVGADPAKTPPPPPPPADPPKGKKSQSAPAAPPKKTDSPKGNAPANAPANPAPENGGKPR